MLPSRFHTCLAAGVLLLALGGSAAAQAPPPPFALHDGDTVVFYGDSTTDQRLYTTDVENYVVTRFPALHIRFVHSGWGGDRVTGGGGGPIDTRLPRDVFAYTQGYTHIVDSISRHCPACA